MSRLEKLVSLLNELSLDAFYITYNPNVRYLSNFSGSSGSLLLTRNGRYFFTDFRYKDQSAKQVKGFDIIINYENSDELKKVIERNNLTKVGFESTHMSYGTYDKLKNTFNGVQFIPLTERVEDLTVQKTEDEIKKIKKAVDITDKTFSEMLNIIKPGMTELELSAEITYAHKKHGALKDSFDPIVASGWRASLPHGIATSKKIEKGDMLTLDIGCVYEGFCSDMTRTIAVGKPSQEMEKIYRIVLDAQLRAIEKAKANISSKELDRVARDYITKNGYGENFGHGLGHGLGVEVHELPGLSQRTEIQLKENCVVTIEPGVYIENVGGVRIEDDVLLKKDGCEVLTASPKELIIV